MATLRISGRMKAAHNSYYVRGNPAQIIAKGLIFKGLYHIELMMSLFI